MYASPERWFAIQKSGYLRDSKRQLILPAIVFRRTGFARDDAITMDKLDANNPKLHYTFEKKYYAKNRYDNFSVQQGIIPQREYYNVAIPDYVTLSYDFIIWTHYIEHMNKIDIETAWKHFYPTEPFDEDKAKMKQAEGVQQINFEIQQIKDNLENNKYGEHTTSDMDDLSYFMEVVETIDSIAIARITGSQAPVYRIRIGDFILIKK